MQSNYNINMSTILNDYFKCIGAFENCKMLYENKDLFKIESEDTEEIKQIKKGREADLLSELGKVGEKAFKYILGLENLKISPNMDPITFEAFFRKSNALKEFAEKHGISRDDKKIFDLINYYDANNQKAHNFDYWYSVIEVTMKDFAKKFKKFLEYNHQSKKLIEYCEEENEYIFAYENDYEIFNPFSLAFNAAIFPAILEHKLDNFTCYTEKQIKYILKTKRNYIKQNGDIFTRLRYASNNNDNQEFNLEQVYDIIENIITFINLIHFNKDNLEFDLNKSYAHYKALEYSNILMRNQEEINNIFSLNLPWEDLDTILFSKLYSYQDIVKLFEIGVDKKDLWVVMAESLRARDIIYFNQRGIYDYHEMRNLINQYNDGEIKSIK